jgi:acyl dehydratase
MVSWAWASGLKEATVGDFDFQGLGQVVTFSKTVAECDVYLFAGITGDLSPNHVNEQFMRSTQLGHRIAHGALLVGYMSTASTMAAEKCAEPASGFFPVSLGYDRIRFIKPVFINDTITVTYTIDGYDRAKRRSTAHVELVNERGELAAVASHIMSWLKRA